jgi:hypothetical protein
LTGGERIGEFVSAVEEAFTAGSLLRLKLGGYQGTEAELKSVEARKIVAKGEEKLSFTYHFKTRDIIKNLSLDDAVAQLRGWLGGDFRHAQLATTSHDLTLERNGDKFRLKRTEVAGREAVSAGHDREKNRPLVASAKPWLVDLKLTDESGHVRKDAQDKFRQINKMVEIFAPLIQAIKAEKPVIVDMGAGKGYLDFALYDYLGGQGQNCSIIGVELRDALVADSNKTAQKSGFADLRFVAGRIDGFDAVGSDAVIALHACDTATDDAIAKGVAAGASLIAVAPCCHKQVRREMEAGQAAGSLAPMLRHGIFLERQAEMVTDTLRALLLEREGYRTKVFEFVSDAHTPKNNLIVAEKDSRAGRDRAAVQAQIDAVKVMFGVGEHYLERVLGR